MLHCMNVQLPSTQKCFHISNININIKFNAKKLAPLETKQLEQYLSSAMAFLPFFPLN